MTLADTMRALSRMGTAQNVKVYQRHGAGDNLFGVSFANLRELQKAIGRDQALAMELNRPTRTLLEAILRTRNAEGGRRNTEQKSKADCGR